MASQRLTFEFACEVYVKWYRDIRVDFLLESELNYELEIRDITIANDPTLTSRRRCLREKLKCEKDPNVRQVYSHDRPVIDEIRECNEKYSELCEKLKGTEKNGLEKCKVRLLHLANRIKILLNYIKESPFITDRFRLMFLDIVEKVSVQFFYEHLAKTNLPQENQDEVCPMENLSPVLEGTNDPGDGSSSEEIERNSTRSPSRNLNAPMNKLTETEITWINSLQRRVAQLEKSQSKITSDKSTQTSQVRFNSSQVTPASVPRCTPDAIQSTLSGHIFHHTKNIEMEDEYLDRNSFSDSYESNIPIESCTNSYLNSARQNFAQLGAIRRNFALTEDVPKLINGKCSQMGHSDTQPPNASLFAQPNPPVSNQSWQNRRNVNSCLGSHTTNRSLPVSKWSILKYDGEDQGLKLNEFLEYVQALSIAEHVSERELFDSAIHLFKGPALNWYMTMCASGRLFNWQHLVFEMKRTFMHPELDSHLKSKIHQRKQQHNESFSTYYYEMERLFRAMSVQISDFEKVKILKENMKRDYKRQLAFVHIVDLPSLVEAAQKVDALIFPAYNKVFGNEKSVSAISENQRESTQKNGKNKNRNENAEENQAGPSAKVNQVYSHSYHSRKDVESSLPSGSRNNPQQSVVNHSVNQYRPVLSLEEMISSHRAPPSNCCYNCGKYGHKMIRCSLPRGVLCGKCGFRGYPTENCPFCIKNELTANESRRSLNPNA